MVSLVGLLAFTVSVAGSVSHFKLVKHEICAEHGALVEDRGGGHESNASAEHEAHEPQKHCSVLACMAYVASAPPVDDLAPLTVLVSEVAMPFSRLPDGQQSHEPLSRAPKTSPPAA